MGNFPDTALCIIKGRLMNTKYYTAEELICNESFQRYCSGQNTSDTQYWDTWIKENPSNLEEVHEAIRVISILSGNQGNVAEQLCHLKDSIQRFDHLKSAVNLKTEEIAITRPAKRISKYYLAAAASVIVLLMAGYFIFFQEKTITPAVLVHNSSSISSGEEPRKTVVLEDGSVVTLRKNSTITLSNHFSKSNRELNLSGEAFFDVTHNASLPFIVHTEDVNIEVLGTVFNVSAYPGSAQTETSLFRGKVSVSSKVNPQNRIILTPNKKLVLLRSANVPDAQPANALKVVPLTADPVNHKAKEIEWLRNRLKIEDEPLSSIAEKLQQWYGIHIVFKDEEVKKYRYSGTFETETVLKALEALQLSYPFSFQVENENIVISR